MDKANGLSPPSDLASDNGSEYDLEMSNMQDIVVTPNAVHYGNKYGGDDDEDSDHDDGDEGSRALLSPRMRRPERTERIDGRTWPQVKSIVIEVCLAAPSRLSH
jgi:hypothetical protein